MTITLDDLTVDQPDVTRRDRWGRYLVVPPSGGKPKGYTRATTVAKALEDQHSLIAWKARVAAKGLTLRPELLKMIAVEQNRQRIDELVEQAAQAGGATERRDEGTALHRALELHFNGAAVPALFRPDVDAVLAALATHRLTVLAGMTERICVLDAPTVAGTFDLVLVDAEGQAFVADFKTGKSLDYSGLAFATQLAVYAHADALYTQGAAKDGSQDRREPMPAVSRAVALVVHVQPGSGRCAVHDVDIARGRALLNLALEVRGQRSTSKTLITPRATAGTAAPSARTVEPSEPAPPSSGSGGSRPVTRRDELAERLRTLRAVRPEALAVIAAHWPDGVPAWNSKALYSKADFDRIDALVSTYEAAAQTPFTPPAEERMADLIPERAVPMAPPEAPPAPVFDEGGPRPADEVQDLREAMQALTGEARLAALALLAAARDGGVPIGYETDRQWRIRRAIFQWVRTRGDDDELLRAALVHVLGDDRVQPGFPTGAVLGALTINEAEALYDAAQDIAGGALVLVIDAQGTRLEAADVPHA